MVAIYQLCMLVDCYIYTFLLSWDEGRFFLSCAHFQNCTRSSLVFHGSDSMWNIAVFYPHWLKEDIEGCWVIVLGIIFIFHFFFSSKLFFFFIFHFFFFFDHFFFSWGSFSFFLRETMPLIGYGCCVTETSSVMCAFLCVLGHIWHFDYVIYINVYYIYINNKAKVMFSV